MAAVAAAGKRGAVSNAGWYALVAVMAIGATIFILSLIGGGEPQAPTRVWSPEHGHYHTLP